MAIIERGTHESLTQDQGWYYDTFKAQSLRQHLVKDLDETLERGTEMTADVINLTLKDQLKVQYVF